MLHKEDSLDRYDFLMGAVTGICAGLLDALWVDKPGIEALNDAGRTVVGKDQIDRQFDQFVLWLAKHNGWQPRQGNENRLDLAVKFLEKNAIINYDQSTTKGTNGLIDHLSYNNHHLKSLGHSPDLVGLFVSVLDQFSGTSTFISNGKFLSYNTTAQELTGSNFPAKVFCGCSNWFWHLASDIAGSSGTIHRGKGIPIPFYNMFLQCDFGQIGKKYQTFGELMTQAFEEGYDLRFGVKMTIPILLGELVTALCWSFKRYFYHKWDWRDCIPSSSYASYRRSRLVHSSAFCLVDGAHAYFKGHGDPIEIILHMNLIAWLRLVHIIIKEILITYGRTYKNVEEDIAIINKAIQEELDKLKSIDYQQWQIENELVRDLNRQLKETSDERLIGQLAGDYIFSHGGKLKPRDEFAVAFRSNGNLL